MSAARAIERVDAYWASFFGCRIEAMRAARTLVLPHVGLEDYAGVFLLRRGPACLVSVPAPAVAELTQRLAALPPEIVFDATFLSETFSKRVDRIIGPAWYGCADGERFQPPSDRQGRLLESGDADAFRCLVEACGETEREHSSMAFDRPPLFGCFLDGRLVAVAGYQVWDGELANIGVLTHPAHRGRGYGRAVVSSIAAEAHRRGLVPHYRALLTNEASIAVARALGFQEYAASLAVRLRAVPVE
jgi:GNAT superfamily N-acetyltransferase